MLPIFSAPISDSPFPFALKENALKADIANSLLNWLETSAPWKLKIASFYQQFEFSFLDCELPKEVSHIFSQIELNKLRQNIESIFNTKLSSKIDITAHKLVEGHTIKIHNDYIIGQESHRVLIQLNRGWNEEMGGYLMLFSNESPESLVHAFLPIHGSAFAFEISHNSLHAVSSIIDGERYTLVLSFFKDSHE